MKNKISVKAIAGTGILTAIEVVFYIIGSNIAIGPINLNLALVPICIGAILYGPLCGGFLGLINGVATLLTPLTQSYFMNPDMFGELCILGTFVICLTKCTVAGLLCGFVYKLFKKGWLGAIISSLVVPIVNTGLFILGALAFYSTEFETILKLVLTFNFLIEIGTSIVLSPVIVRIVRIVRKETSIEKK